MSQHGFAQVDALGERDGLYVRHAAEGSYVLRVYNDGFYLRSTLSLVGPDGEMAEVAVDERLMAALSRRGGYETILTHEEATDALLAGAAHRIGPLPAQG